MTGQAEGSRSKNGLEKEEYISGGFIPRISLVIIQFTRIKIHQFESSQNGFHLKKGIYCVICGLLNSNSRDSLSGISIPDLPYLWINLYWSCQNGGQWLAQLRDLVPKMEWRNSRRSARSFLFFFLKRRRAFVIYIWRHCKTYQWNVDTDDTHTHPIICSYSSK